MYSRMLVLQFSKTEVGKPLVCFLATDYNLTFNILKATILPRKEGIMVLELSGNRKDFNRGVRYLTKILTATKTSAPIAAHAQPSVPLVRCR